MKKSKNIYLACTLMSEELFIKKKGNRYWLESKTWIVLYYVEPILKFVPSTNVHSIAYRLRRQLTNAFIINQSIIDLLASLLMVLHQYSYMKSKLTGTGGIVYCKLWKSRAIMWSLFMASTYNLLAMNIERYMKVCKLKIIRLIRFIIN